MRTVALGCLLAVLLPISSTAAPATLQTGVDAARFYSLARREAQFQHLQAMGNARIEYGNYGRVRMIRGQTGLSIPSVSQLRAGNSAEAVFQQLGSALMASGSEALVVRKVTGALGGGYTLFLDQSIDGIPVLDAGLNVRLTRDRQIDLVSSLFVPGDAVSREPALSFESARTLLQTFLITGGVAETSALRLAREGALSFWTNEGKEEKARLLWLIDASYTDPSGTPESIRFGVDATTGEVRHAERQLFGLNRTAYSLNYVNNNDISTYPQALQFLWAEGSPNPANSAAYSVYQKVEEPIQTWISGGLGLHYDTFGIVVNHPATFTALWNRNQHGFPFLIFGDFMAGEMDAVAHEYGHGIYRPMFSGSVPSLPFDEWHAVNEFYGDLSAVVNDVRLRFGVPIPQTWHITSNVIRNLSAPKSVPGDFRDWYPEKRFVGNTANVSHANATIYGHALYLMINGGTHHRVNQSARHGPIPNIFVQPTSASVVHAIFAAALIDLATTHSPINGPNLKAATVTAAMSFGGPSTATQVANAWTAVGINYNCSAPPPIPNPVITPDYCKGRHVINWVHNFNDTYHGQVAAPGWNWDISGITVLDTNVDSCEQNVSGPTKFRMRACNGCGCSAWTGDSWMYYWSPCQ